MKVCPLSGEPCSEECMWFIGNECVMSKISYSLMLLTKNTEQMAQSTEGN